MLNWIWINIKFDRAYIKLKKKKKIREKEGKDDRSFNIEVQFDRFYDLFVTL